MSEYKWPSEKELTKIREESEEWEGTLGLSENPTPLEQFRWDICQQFIIFKKSNNLTNEDFANLLGTDQAKISKILRHRIEEFTTDRLLTFLHKIKPNTKLKVS